MQLKRDRSISTSERFYQFTTGFFVLGLAIILFSLLALSISYILLRLI